MNILDAILIAEIGFIITVALLWVAGILYEKYYNWRHPVFPYCDIDPLCHPAFARDKNGDGWIGNVRVNG